MEELFSLSFYEIKLRDWLGCGQWIARAHKTPWRGALVLGCCSRAPDAPAAGCRRRRRRVSRRLRCSPTLASSSTSSPRPLEHWPGERSATRPAVEASSLWTCLPGGLWAQLCSGRFFQQLVSASAYCAPAAAASASPAASAQDAATAALTVTQGIRTMTGGGGAIRGRVDRVPAHRDNGGGTRTRRAHRAPSSMPTGGCASRGGVCRGLMPCMRHVGT